MFTIRRKAESGGMILISYQRILAEMEKQLTTAKHSHDEQSVREALSAIRALCEVALDPIEINNDFRKNTLTEPKPLEHSSPSLDTDKLKEDDANGESIFDF